MSETGPISPARLAQLLAGLSTSLSAILAKMDNPSDPITNDVLNRWGRQLGQIDLARYLGVACGPTNPIDVEDTGLNTNPERYRQEHGGSFGELVIVASGAGGQQIIRITPPNPVGESLVFRLKEVSVRHSGTSDTVVSVRVVGEAIDRLTLDVRARTTREWESEIGRVVGQTLTVVARSSDVAGGTTYVSGSYIEANV